MEKKELEIISQLMEELQKQMEPAESDFAERLGRKKPEVEILKIEGKVPSDEEEVQEEESEEDMFGEPEMESEEDSLKQRLMKLRGE
jgi:hypothetical protein